MESFLSGVCPHSTVWLHISRIACSEDLSLSALRLSISRRRTTCEQIFRRHRRMYILAAGRNLQSAAPHDQLPQFHPLPSANQFTCCGSGLQVCVQGHSRFKVRTLPWPRSIHRALLSAASHFPPLEAAAGLTAFHPPPAHAAVRLERERLDTFFSDWSKLRDRRLPRDLSQPEWTSAPHGSRPGAAAIGRIESLHLSRQARRWSTAGWHGVRELGV